VGDLGGARSGSAEELLPEALGFVGLRRGLHVEIDPPVGRGRSQGGALAGDRGIDEARSPC
jgi:hypothetical protein